MRYTRKTNLGNGWAGFIGSSLANRLAEETEVIAINNTYLGTPANLNERVRFVERNVLKSDPEYVENPIPEAVYVHDTYAAVTKIHEVTGGESKVSLGGGNSTGLYAVL